VGKEEVLGAIDDKNSLLINALTEDLHLGENPRYGRPGRIPKSINIPFHEFVDSNSNKLKSVHSVFDLLNQNDVNPENKIINYCGGGIAATLNTFALYQLDFKKIQIYDNSMSEWAMDNELPIESG
jgi:thiosulfate/3-mercaptopyruvate sulfurtransferase